MPIPTRSARTMKLVMVFIAAWVAGGFAANGAPEPQPHLSPVAQRARLIDERCRVLEAEGLAALESGEGAAAIEIFERLIGLRSDSPYLEPAGERAGPPGESDPAILRTFMEHVETALRDRAVGLKAYAQWRSGRRAEAESTVSGAASWRKAFAERVAQRASALFDQRNWSDAAQSFGYARSQLLQAQSQVYDREAGRLQYNQALAEFKAGRPGTARGLLEHLAEALPDYRSQQVRAVLAGIEAESTEPN